MITNDGEATTPPVPKSAAKPPADDMKGVMVSEEFQKQAHQLLHKASKHEVKHVHDRAYAREDELRQQEQDKEPKAETPDNFTVEGAPD